LVAHFDLEPIEQEVPGLLAAQLRNLFQLASLARSQLLDLADAVLDVLLAVAELALAALEGVELSVEAFFLRMEPLLLGLELPALRADLRFRRVPYTNGLFLGLQQHFLASALRLGDRLGRGGFTHRRSSQNATSNE